MYFPSEYMVAWTPFPEKCCFCTCVIYNFCSKLRPSHISEKRWRDGSSFGTGTAQIQNSLWVNFLTLKAVIEEKEFDSGAFRNATSVLELSK